MGHHTGVRKWILFLFLNFLSYQVQKRCIGTSPAQRVDLSNPDWKVEVAEFLWPATERALRDSESSPHPTVTASNMWPHPTTRNETFISHLRVEQQKSYLKMEQLINKYMLPERLFGEHLGKPCLLGASQNCWNGHAFSE